MHWSAQSVLLLLAMLTWGVGGNAVVYFHHRRLGRPWWAVFDRRKFRFGDLDTGERWRLALLFLITIGLVVTAYQFPPSEHRANAPADPPSRVGHARRGDAPRRT